jgi:hypothetical protein
VNAKSLHVLKLLGAAPAATQPRDQLGRFAAAESDPYRRGFSASTLVSFDPGARGATPQRRDALTDHATAVLALIRARRYGSREPDVWR